MQPPCELDWLQVLRKAVDGTSQVAIGKRLGVSHSAISQVLAGKYMASTARIEARVRGELMRETVQCPVLGTLSRRVCLEEQSRPYYPDPICSAMHRNCPKCQNVINPNPAHKELP